LTAPRVTPADIEANITASYAFHRLVSVGEGVPRMDELKLLTIAVLVLKNGFTVTANRLREP